MNYSQRKERFLRKLTTLLSIRTKIITFGFLYVLIIVTAFVVSFIFFRNYFSLLGLLALPIFFYGLAQNFLHLKRLEMDLPSVLIPSYRDLVNETKYKGFYSKHKLEVFKAKLTNYDLSKEDKKNT